MSEIIKDKRCAICLSTDRVHESLLIECKECHFQFHKDCLNCSIESDISFICPSCNLNYAFQSCSLCQQTILFPFEKDEDGDYRHMCCRFWHGFTKADLRKKCSICKKAGGDLILCSKSEKGYCNISAHILCGFIALWYFDEENKRIFCSNHISPVSSATETFTESNHLFLFYISCRRISYLIQNINLTEQDSNAQLYNEWKTINNEERQTYVNAVSQVRSLKRPLLPYSTERDTLQVWMAYQTEMLITHLTKFKKDIVCDGQCGKHMPFTQLIDEITQLHLKNPEQIHYLECTLLRRIGSIYNLEEIFKIMEQNLMCNNEHYSLSNFTADFERLTTLFELKYNVKSYKLVSDAIEKNDQPCVQTEWRRTPFPTRYYEEISQYELCEGMNDNENESELTMNKLKSSMHLKCEGSCCNEEGVFSLMHGRFDSKCPCMASGSECTSLCPCHEECKNRDVQHKKFIDVNDDIHVQNVWGMDCYSRRCLEICILAIGKTLEYAQNYIKVYISRTINAVPCEVASDITQSLIQLAKHDDYDIALTAVAILEQTTTRGLSFFRIHPKGMGIVCRRPGGIPKATAIAPYLGEVYPPWRWFEKQDGIKNAQKRLGYKPVLPDFYNITLERNIEDEKGFDVLFVDPVCRGNLGSRLCHSCDPNCATMTVNVNGQFTIVVYAIKDISEGEELTFDYACVSESEEEYRAAVCLCNSVKCRGSFLYFTNARAFQQVMSVAHTFLSRTAIILRSCVEPFTSEDEKILNRIGIRSSVLENSPTWLKKYASLISEYILYENSVLPTELLKITLPSQLYTKDTAEGESKGVLNSRLHNLVVTIDKILYFLRRQSPNISTLPLRLLKQKEVTEYLWNDEHSIVKRLYCSMVASQHPSEESELQHVESIISSHVKSCEEARKKMKEVAAVLAEMKPRNTARHLAAHDLLTLYSETRCFFTTTSSYQGFTSDVDIRTCDLGMSNDSFQKALKNKKSKSSEDDDSNDAFKKNVKKSKLVKRKDFTNPTIATAMQVRYRDLRRYSGCYVWGQLVGWYKQTVNNPAASLYADRRGSLSLPDIESCYGTEFDYTPSARQTLLERIITQPSTMWPVGGFWKFKNPYKIYGSPMFDFYVLNDQESLTNCMAEITIEKTKKNLQLPPLSSLSALPKEKLPDIMNNPEYPTEEQNLFLRGIALPPTPAIPQVEKYDSHLPEPEEIEKPELETPSKKGDPGIVTRSKTGTLKRKSFTDGQEEQQQTDCYRDDEDEERPKKKRKSPRKSHLQSDQKKDPQILQPGMPMSNGQKWPSNPAAYPQVPVAPMDPSLLYQMSGLPQPPMMDYSRYPQAMMPQGMPMPMTHGMAMQQGMPMQSPTPQGNPMQQGMPMQSSTPQGIPMQQGMSMQQTPQGIPMQQGVPIQPGGPTSQGMLMQQGMPMQPGMQMPMTGYPPYQMQNGQYMSQFVQYYPQQVYGGYMPPDVQRYMMMNQNLPPNARPYFQNQFQPPTPQQQQQQQKQQSSQTTQQPTKRPPPQGTEISSETKSLIDSFEKIVPSLTDASSLSNYLLSLDVSAIKSKVDLDAFMQSIISQQVNHPNWAEAQNASKVLITKMNTHLETL